MLALLVLPLGIMSSITLLSPCHYMMDAILMPSPVARRPSWACLLGETGVQPLATCRTLAVMTSPDIAMLLVQFIGSPGELAKQESVAYMTLWIENQVHSARVAALDQMNGYC